VTKMNDRNRIVFPFLALLIVCGIVIREYGVPFFESSSDGVGKGENITSFGGGTGEGPTAKMPVEGRDRVPSASELQSDFHVLVVDQSGDAVADAFVGISPPREGLIIGGDLNRVGGLSSEFRQAEFSGITDQNGFAIIGDIPASWQAIAVFCSADFYLTYASWHPQQLPSAGDSRTVNIVLRPATELYFLVLDDVNGHPISGASITEIVSIKGRRSMFYAETSLDGRAVLFGKESHGMEFIVRSKGYLETRLSLSDYQGILGENGVAVVGMKKGLGLRVVVQDADGVPVQSSSVYLSASVSGHENVNPADPRSSPKATYQGETNVKGVLEITGLKQTKGLLVLAEHSGRYGWEFPVRLDDGVRIALDDLESTELRFLTPDGLPVGGMDVAIVSSDLVGWPPVASGKTGTDGMIEFLLRPGTYGVFGSNAKWAVLPGEPIVVTNTGSEPHVFHSLASAGVAFAEANSEAHLKGGPLAFSLANVYPKTRLSRHDEQIKWHELAANFNFEKVGALFDGQSAAGLIPGQYWAQIRGPGCVPQFTEIELVAGEQAKVVADVVPESSLVVEVTDATGGAVPRAWLWAKALGSIPKGTSLLATRSSRTDYDGVSFMRPLASGSYRVEVARHRNGIRSEQIVEVEVGENKAVFVLQDLPGSVLVQLDRQLTVGAKKPRVTLSSVNGNRGGRRVREASFSSDGLARFDSVEAGEYSAELTGVSANDLEQRIHVEEGREAIAFFKSPTGPELEVRVIDENGLPVSEATVLLSPTNMRGRRSGLERRLFAGSPVPKVESVGITSDLGIANFWPALDESYKVLAFMKGYQISEQTFVANSAEANHAIELTVSPAAQLTVVVGIAPTEGETKEPELSVKTLRVKALWAEGGAVNLAYNSQNRAFETTVLPPGQITIVIEALNKDRKLVRLASRDELVGVGGGVVAEFLVKWPGS